MRRYAILTIFALALAACANDPAPGPSGPAEPQLDQTRMGIYESLARELVGAEKVEWKKIVIVSELCANAGGAEGPEGCDDSLDAAEQDELAQRLGDLGPRTLIRRGSDAALRRSVDDGPSRDTRPSPRHDHRA